MGMFDTVNFYCPRCGRTLDLQSKAGDCTLVEYDQDSVPLKIAADLCNTSVWCDDCKESFRVVSMIPTRVAMKLF
jgi:uncharacterized protein YbaR (Trm112 family)